jgi:hypothetical protein
VDLHYLGEFGVKLGMFAENAVRNGAFSATTWYLGKREFWRRNFNLNLTILDILNLGLVFY